MKNKFLLAFLLVFFVAGLVIFFQIDGEKAEKEDVDISKGSFGEIIRAHLFQAGNDYEIGKRNEGEEMKEFQKGDYFGVSGKVETEKKIIINTQILDENGTVITEDPMSSLEKEESGTFGVCCVLVPDAEGNYFLRLEIEDVEKDLPFEVM